MAIYTHEFDRTGSKATNLISSESHDINDRSMDIILPFTGLFYTTGLVVATDAGVILTLGTDYKLVGPDHYITGLTGLSTAGGIELTDKTFVGTIELSLQTVGGPEGSQSAVLHELRERLDNYVTDNVSYSSLQDLPTQYPPEPHTHSVLTDLSDLDVLRDRLDSIINALVRNRPLGLSVSLMDDYINRILVLHVELKRSFLALSRSLLARNVVPTSSGSSSKRRDFFMGQL